MNVEETRWYSTTSHKPVLFTPKYIQHVHTTANRTLDWHLLRCIHMMNVDIRTPKQIATHCIAVLT
jgi:hypothetical protein